MILPGNFNFHIIFGNYHLNSYNHLNSFKQYAPQNKELNDLVKKKQKKKQDIFHYVSGAREEKTQLTCNSCCGNGCSCPVLSGPQVQWHRRKKSEYQHQSTPTANGIVMFRIRCLILTYNYAEAGCKSK